MAFFGLAHVGPQSSFLNNRKNAYTVAIFAASEFAAAFDSVAHAEHCSSLPLSSLEAVLDAVFHGPPPPLELARVRAALAEAAGEAAALDRDAFLAAIERLQAAPLEVNEDDYAHYKSFNQLCVSGAAGLGQGLLAARLILRRLFYPAHPTPLSRPRRRAHKKAQVRPFVGPEQTQRLPATMLQDIGFEARAFKPEKRFVKNHCAETKFKSELVKAGIYF